MKRLKQYVLEDYFFFSWTFPLLFGIVTMCLALWIIIETPEMSTKFAGVSFLHTSISLIANSGIYMYALHFIETATKRPKEPESNVQKEAGQLKCYSIRSIQVQFLILSVSSVFSMALAASYVDVSSRQLLSSRDSSYDAILAIFIVVQLAFMIVSLLILRYSFVKTASLYNIFILVVNSFLSLASIICIIVSFSF